MNAWNNEVERGRRKARRRLVIVMIIVVMLGLDFLCLPTVAATDQAPDGDQGDTGIIPEEKLRLALELADSGQLDLTPEIRQLIESALPENGGSGVLDLNAAMGEEEEVKKDVPRDGFGVPLPEGKQGGEGNEEGKENGEGKGDLVTGSPYDVDYCFLQHETSLTSCLRCCHRQHKIKLFDGPDCANACLKAQKDPLKQWFGGAFKAVKGDWTKEAKDAEKQRIKLELEEEKRKSRERKRQRELREGQRQWQGQQGQWWWWQQQQQYQQRAMAYPTVYQPVPMQLPYQTPGVAV